MKLLGRVVGILGVAVLWWANFASAGWVIDQTGAGKNSQQQVMIQGNRVKTSMFDAKGNPETVTIMDAEAQTLTVVDFRRHSYMTSTLQEYRDLMENMQKTIAPKMAEAMKKMQAQMKGMPPEQRKMMERMMGSQFMQDVSEQGCGEPPAVEMRKTDQRETIAGYTAVRYDVELDGKVDSQLWLAKDITVGRELDMEKMKQFFRALEKLAACRPMNRFMVGETQAWKLIDEGYPMRVVRGKGEKVTEVVKAEKRDISAAEFMPPEGFTKNTLRDMLNP